MSAINSYLQNLQIKLQQEFNGDVIPIPLVKGKKEPLYSHKGQLTEVLLHLWEEGGLPKVLKNEADLGLLIRNNAMIVVDFDDKNQAKEFETHINEFGLTVKEETKKGFHYFFKATDETREMKISNIVRPFGEGKEIDIITTWENGTGAIISIYPSANKEWINNIIDKEILPTPSVFMKFYKDFIVKPTKKKTPIVEEDQQETNDGETVQKNAIDYDTLKEIVMNIDAKYADEYGNGWRDICWAIMNTAYTNKFIRKGNNLVHEFSKKSKKYDEDEVEEFVQNSGGREDGFGLGTLMKYLKLSNEVVFDKIQLKLNPIKKVEIKGYSIVDDDKDVDDMIYKSRTESHFDIAKVVHLMYGDKYVCCYNGNTPIWYEFKNHRWYEEEDGASLKLAISTEVFKKYCLSASYYLSKSSQAETDTEQAMYAEIGKKLGSVALKLKNAPFKTNIINECKALLKKSNEDFYDKLDNNHYIIGFENGVYDLKTMKFRDGLPEDYVRSCVAYNYNPQVDVVIRNELMKFVDSIVSCQAVREYLLFVLAYNLSGNKYLEQAWFLTGLGRNGKGTLKDLYGLTLKQGAYYQESDIAILTNIKKDANSATSALMALKGKRVAVFSESEDADEKIKVKILKQIVGRDTLSGREMYAKKQCEFKPTFSLMFCFNDMPKLSKLEPNLLDKLNVINFPYRFCDEPKTENDRLIDKTLKNKFENDVRYRQQFMLILLEYFQKYMIMDCTTPHIPDEVKESTKEYIEENNEVGMWLKEKCIITNNKKDMMTPTDMFNLFKNDNTSSSCRNPGEFGKAMSFNGYKVSKHDGKFYYKGIKYNNYMIDDEE